MAARRVRIAAAPSLRLLLRRADSGLAAASLAVRRETPALMILLFHGLFADRAELEQDQTHPMEGLTVSHLKIILEHLCSCGYRFVGPADVLNGLRPGQRYAMLTFDDSYARHQVALSVLAEYRIPGSFFITTTHVLENKGYWWDTLYRERRRRGATRQQIDREIQALKACSLREIDATLVASFGRDCLRPVGDLDRPMTPAELAAFAREEWVCIGNHTCDHAILTHCAPAEAQAQIAGAQEALRSLTGQDPAVIAYPNGNCDEKIARLAQECGLRLGLTSEPRKARLPIQSGTDAAMRLGRFGFLDDRNLAGQCDLARADVSLLRGLRRVRATLRV